MRFTRSQPFKSNIHLSLLTSSFQTSAWRRPHVNSEWLSLPIRRSGVACWPVNTWVGICSLICLRVLTVSIEITGRFRGRRFPAQYIKVCLRQSRRRRNDVNIHPCIGTQKRTSRTSLPSRMLLERLALSATRRADKLPSRGSSRKDPMSFRYLARLKLMWATTISYNSPTSLIHDFLFSLWRKMSLQLRLGLLMKRLRKCAASQRAQKHPRPEIAILREW